MASDPFRLRVLKALTDTIKAVTISNGYEIDLGDFVDADTGLTQARVFRGRTMFGDNDPLPMVAILEDPRGQDTPPQPQHTSGAAVGTMRLLIQGFVQDDKDHPLDPAYIASSQIVKALALQKAPKPTFSGPDILGFNGRVQSMTIEQPVHRPADNEISEKAYFVLGVTLSLVEKLDDPFF